MCLQNPGGCTLYLVSICRCKNRAGVDESGKSVSSFRDYQVLNFGMDLVSSEQTQVGVEEQILSSPEHT